MASITTPAPSTLPGPAAVDDLARFCPRCGYDLRGAIATWSADACPLAGRCVECGLDFEWVDIMRGDELRPPWCIEFAPWRRLPGAVLGTWWRALLPHRFYRRLRMTHEIRVRRLVLTIAGFFVMIYASLALASGVLMYVTLRTWNNSWAAPTGTWSMVRHAVLQPFSSTPRGCAPGALLARHFTPIAWSLAAVLFAALLPIGMLVLPVSMRQARVRRQHLLRIGTYNLAWLPLLLAAILLLIIGDAYYVPAFSRIAAALALVASLGLPLAWYCALRRYLRMPAAGRVAAATTTMAALASVLVLSFVQFDVLVRAMLRMME